ncbi:WD40-repeat-containing domain protein [Dendryphion nanum]|uniref:WD40-repeat-containing domain protein n=1 Tax=Dendryphion nanum TaxID=256645 RepID=A0A9P9IZH3_9PLEO|nr:WD40-repeat-containing domain protein [Dendryphion nanum]
MTLHRKTSILTHRPKTSSAVEETSSSSSSTSSSSGTSFDPIMKRTASQTFTPMHLDAVTEDGCSTGYPTGFPTSQHSHSGSLSRASQAVKGGCKQIRRRFSSSSQTTHRPSLQTFLDPNAIPANPFRKPTATEMLQQRTQFQQRLQLQHQDSAVDSPTEGEGPLQNTPTSRFSIKRLASLRQRRPATSGPSGEYPRYNPAPIPVPAGYPAAAPGQAARAAAAAANIERMSLQRREREEETRAFLHGLSPSAHLSDEVIKDSESGVGMSCSSPVESTESVVEKKLDPINYLPAEITTMILSNLDASSLVVAESVSRAWNDAATSSHVWRTVFLRKFEPTVHVAPTPIMMGGAGIGQFQKGKPAPGQDWKTMYKVRATINRRWQNGSPAAIYLNGHTDSVYCCQFDEDKIITGSRDRTIRVWDMKTHKCRKVIGGPANRPVINTPPKLEPHSACTVDNPSMNGTVDGNAIYHVPVDYHEASILCLQYDDRIMVTGSSDHTCIVWNIEGDNFVPVTRLKGHTAGVLDVCLDDKYIISCSKDATINVWDRHTHRHIRTLTGHRGPVNAVQLRGNLLVSASGDGVAKLWNLESGSSVMDFSSQDRGLAAVEFSDDAKHVLAGGNDHVVYKFDARTGELLFTSQKHGGLVRSLFLDAHNNRTISGSYDQSIRVSDYTTGQTYGFYENWTTSWILSAKSDYRRVVATSQDGRALILDFGWKVEGVDSLSGDK